MDKNFISLKPLLKIFYEKNSRAIAVLEKGELIGFLLKKDIEKTASTVQDLSGEKINIKARAVWLKKLSEESLPAVSAAGHYLGDFSNDQIQDIMNRQDYFNDISVFKMDITGKVIEITKTGCLNLKKYLNANVAEISKKILKGEKFVHIKKNIFAVKYENMPDGKCLISLKPVINGYLVKKIIENGNYGFKELMEKMEKYLLGELSLNFNNETQFSGFLKMSRQTLKYKKGKYKS